MDMYDFYDEDTNEDDNFGDESEIIYTISAGSQSRAMSGDGNRL